MRFVFNILFFIGVASSEVHYGPNEKETPQRVRIIGGQEAEVNQYPWQVALSITSANGNEYFCGGSLISEKWILTAAHCLSNVVSVMASLGVHNINVNEPSRQDIPAEDFTVHPKWNISTASNDIALVRLTTEAVINDAVQVVTLATAGTFAGYDAELSGWGKVSSASTEISPILKRIDLKVISNVLCTLYYSVYIKDSNICTSGSGGIGACQGDSGGPLLDHRRNRD
ncbi:brachyurin-like isoform X2 [Aethina tumida]|uniref:brachyurin-like isoform X2 n=1 Tax=Aethina tumida TaxID=116153 RepID=UPI00214778BA|nr:brachyurin-like isoform X2 [Aethina tumida]